MKQIYVKQDIGLVSEETHETFLSEHFPTDQMVLIIGCGAGVHSRLYPNSVNIDIDPVCTKFCKSDGVSNCIVCRADYLPFKEGTFDRIMLVDVIEHFPNMEYLYKVVYELLRVGTRGSLVAAILPMRDDLLLLRETYNKARGWAMPAMSSAGHTLAITKKKLLTVFHSFVCIKDESSSASLCRIPLPHFISGGRALIVFERGDI